jgi:alpha-galactosidase
VSSIEVAGLANVGHDYRIPLEFGVDQCIGDTIGPGGIFKFLRTAPTWLDIVRDVERLAPSAIVLNYTNPMSALTLLALRVTDLPVVGLCHSVQATSQQLASYLEMPYDELIWECAGINHNSWFTRLERNGRNLYPVLLERASLPEVYERDPVRFDLMKHLGAFVTESSAHFSEYVPYFRKRPGLVARYADIAPSGAYASYWPDERVKADGYVAAMLDGTEDVPMERSHEYAAVIVEAIELHRPGVIYGNVRNAGLIDNLPDGCVEVATLVDGRGLHPCHFGRLPEQLAALNRSHMAVHDLLVTSVLDRDPQAARYALTLDPLTAAVCSLEEIDGLFDAMWSAQEASLAYFAP